MPAWVQSLCILERIQKLLLNGCFCDLGKYHARNIHSWEGGSCDFHSEKRCTCGNCEEDEVECEGREYATKNPLTCPLRGCMH